MDFFSIFEGLDVITGLFSLGSKKKEKSLYYSEPRTNNWIMILKWSIALVIGIGLVLCLVFFIMWLLFA